MTLMMMCAAMVRPPGLVPPPHGAYHMACLWHARKHNHFTWNLHHQFMHEVPISVVLFSYYWWQVCMMDAHTEEEGKQQTSSCSAVMCVWCMLLYKELYGRQATLAHTSLTGVIAAVPCGTAVAQCLPLTQ